LEEVGWGGEPGTGDGQAVPCAVEGGWTDWAAADAVISKALPVIAAFRVKLRRVVFMPKTPLRPIPEQTDCVVDPS